MSLSTSESDCQRSGANACPELKFAAAKAFDKLKKYYSKAEQPVYAISQALDPRCRFTWWTYKNWPEDWIKAAKANVMDEWEKYRLETRDEQHEVSDDDYEPVEVNTDALQAYLSEKVSKTKDVLQYWKGRQEHAKSSASGNHQPLFEMVQWYLAVPASSVPSERCFSRAKLFIPNERNRLSPESLMQSVLVDSWRNFLDGNGGDIVDVRSEQSSSLEAEKEATTDVRNEEIEEEK